jgi:peptidoglycan/xylan/chitin deacetylase (PgdA/CDA1 family)
MNVGFRAFSLGLVQLLVSFGISGLLITASAQRIAITFDDLPAHGPLPPKVTRIEVAKQIIDALHRANVPATYGFINGIAVQDQPDTVNVLDAWRAAGNPLGNHTWSHMNLNEHSAADFEADIAHNEQLLGQHMDGADWHWFRYPFLAEGNTPEKKMGVRAWLGQKGYKIAGVTMSFADYEWNEPYARCVQKGDTKAVSWLETTYLRAAEQNVRYDHQMSKKLYGHDIPYVLLMHIGAFDAHMLPRLLAMYKHHGIVFVSLHDAEEDAFYKYDIDPKILPGPDMLEQAMGEKHWPLPKHIEYSKRLDAICR